jgi:hypothetical protein
VFAASVLFQGCAADSNRVASASEQPLAVMTALGSWQGELVACVSECVLQHHPVGGAGGSVAAGAHFPVSGSPRDTDPPDDWLTICSLTLFPFQVIKTLQ